MFGSPLAQMWGKNKFIFFYISRLHIAVSFFFWENNVNKVCDEIEAGYRNVVIFVVKGGNHLGHVYKVDVYIGMQYANHGLPIVVISDVENLKRNMLLASFWYK